MKAYKNIKKLLKNGLSDRSRRGLCWKMNVFHLCKAEIKIMLFLLHYLKKRSFYRIA